jgi:hypothetical protein
MNDNEKDIEKLDNQIQKLKERGNPEQKKTRSKQKTKTTVQIDKLTDYHIQENKDKVTTKTKRIKTIKDIDNQKVEEQEKTKEIKKIDKEIIEVLEETPAEVKEEKVPVKEESEELDPELVKQYKIYYSIIIILGILIIVLFYFLFH